MTSAQDPFVIWAEKIAAVIRFRGLSVRAAATEIGVGRQVIDSILKGDRSTQEGNRILLDSWLEQQVPELITLVGGAPQGDLRHWTERLRTVTGQLSSILGDMEGQAFDALKDDATVRKELGTAIRNATPSADSPPNSQRKKGRE